MYPCEVFHYYDSINFAIHRFYSCNLSSQGNQTKQNQLSEVKLARDLEEWFIPHQELQFDDPIAIGRHGLIFKGKWHGDVLIHRFENPQDDAEIIEFWTTLSNLCLIRHENIVLFMGACIESPYLSVVFSMKRASSLFETLHIRHKYISVPEKLKIAQQVAQALGYLHSRKIIHKRLTSNNIILENKVKVSVMDLGSTTYHYQNLEANTFSKGYLTYLSPQLMRATYNIPPYQRFIEHYDSKTDSYAFGTILYELMTGNYPFKNKHPHEIIWLIANGQHEDVSEIKISKSVRDIVASCWSPKPEKRPEFSQILKELPSCLILKKGYSNSEPERLNKLGLV